MFFIADIVSTNTVPSPAAHVMHVCYALLKVTM